MSTGELAEKLAEEKLEEERKLEGQEPKVSMTAEQIAAKKKRHETELAAEKAEVWQSISALCELLSRRLPALQLPGAGRLGFHCPDRSNSHFCVRSTVSLSE